MSYTLTREDFASLASCWADPGQRLRWDSVFALPAWWAVWWQEFGADAEPYLVALRQGNAILGVAPLKIRGKIASFIGEPDVCDYMDFVVVNGAEGDFFPVLLDELAARGISSLELADLRSDSTVLTYLKAIAEGRGYPVDSQQTGVSLEMALPTDWEQYLGLLDNKQRHEVGRKLRRLHEAGVVDYYYHDGGQQLGDLLGTFFHLFSLSRREKADFMTSRMESFFVSMATTMAGLGLLRLGVLEVDAVTTAMVMAFDYGDTLYLYNSAYDPGYQSLSVGLLSKVFCIQESIVAGKKTFDFLKGDEVYKHHLGGREVPLYNCRIKLT